MMAGLDAHAKPPEFIRQIYKKYQRVAPDEISLDRSVLDLSCSHNHGLRPIHQVSTGGLAEALNLPATWSGGDRAVQVYEVEALPGLHIIPNLLDSVVQRALLDRLLHRDLADSRHKTNIGLHYHVPYDVCSGNSRAARELSNPDKAAGKTQDDTTAATMQSFFTCAPSSDVKVRPMDSGVHKDLTISQFLNRKLRWITLGGQYDWTRKLYPPGQHPDFPSDIAAAVSAVFPDMRPESAICNLYTPGDTLSLHRDVSEQVDAGLASLSIGCDALFIVGLGDGDRPEEAGQPSRTPEDVSAVAVMRLRSGDAIYMSEAARYAWHGVPQVIRGTCPEELASWPAGRPRKEGHDGADDDGPFQDWQGWLANKRINLNVRQMREA